MLRRKGGQHLDIGYLPPVPTTIFLLLGATSSGSIPLDPVVSDKTAEVIRQRSGPSTPDLEAW